LLNEGERSERLQAVPEDLRSKPQSNLLGVLSNERMRYIKNKNKGTHSKYNKESGLVYYFF